MKSSMSFESVPDPRLTVEQLSAAYYECELYWARRNEFSHKICSFPFIINNTRSTSCVTSEYQISSYDKAISCPEFYYSQRIALVNKQIQFLTVHVTRSQVKNTREFKRKCMKQRNKQATVRATLHLLIRKYI
jgi:hypothetical protein